MKKLLFATMAIFLSIGAFSSQEITATFKADQRYGQLPLSVHFEGLEDNPGASFTWDFGNGRTSTEKKPSALFSNPGLFKVTLFVRMAEQIDSSFMSIEVLSTLDILKLTKSKAGND